MTDEQLKQLVRDYIISGHESDNADDLHEQDEFYNEELGEFDEPLYRRAREIYRTAKVTVTFDE